MFRLTITDSRGSRRVSLQGNELLLGSDPSCGCVIEGAGVGGHHCYLRVQDDGILLAALPGRPLLVAGQPVERLVLPLGRVFRAGGALVRVDACGRTALPAAPTRAETGRDEFARHLRRKLAAAPWYTISLVVHAVLWAVLDLVRIRVPEPEPPRILLTAELAPAPEPREESDADLSRIAEEVVLTPLDEAVPDLEDAEAAAERRKTAESDFELRDPHRVPRTLGLSAALPSSKVPPLRRLPLPGTGDAPIDTEDLEGEQQRARTVVEQGLGDGVRVLRGIERHEIAVLPGDYDRMQDILALYGVPHEVVPKERLSPSRLRRCRLLCINCGMAPVAAERKKLVRAIRSFVARGGWLMTSDWALDPYLTESYPELVRLHEPGIRQPDTTIAIDAPSADDPLLAGVLRRGGARWWLEDASRFADVDQRGVRVLLASEEMKRRYGSDVVVFEMRPGKGRVLHLLGHFYQKDGTQRGLTAMHRLILNFVAARFGEQE